MSKTHLAAEKISRVTADGRVYAFRDNLSGRRVMALDTPRVGDDVTAATLSWLMSAPGPGGWIPWEMIAVVGVLGERKPDPPPASRRYRGWKGDAR